MKIRIAMLLAMAAVGGCSTTPKTEAEALENCMSTVRSWSYSHKEEARFFMKVSKEKLPETVCRRLAAGVQSGRITEKDLHKLRTGQGTQIFKVLKGH